MSSFVQKNNFTNFFREKLVQMTKKLRILIEELQSDVLLDL